MNDNNWTVASLFAYTKARSRKKALKFSGMKIAYL